MILDFAELVLNWVLLKYNSDLLEQIWKLYSNKADSVVDQVINFTQQNKHIVMSMLKENFKVTQHSGFITLHLFQPKGMYNVILHF